MTEDGARRGTGPGFGGAVHAALPRLLSRTLGPLLRLRHRTDCTFLDRLSQTHTQSMLALSDEHWERLVRTLGLVGFRAVLDVGCGAGAWLGCLAGLNRRVVAVDTDAEALDVARRRCAGADSVEIRSMPAESLQLGDAAFDAVVCFSVLPYLDQPAAIAEMARVLIPGGRLVVWTVGSGYYAKHIAEGTRHDQIDAIRYGLDPILVAGARALGATGIAPMSLRSWSPRAVRGLLEQHGFEVDRVAWDVEGVDPSWPRSFLRRPVYFITFATKRTSPHGPDGPQGRRHVRRSGRARRPARGAAAAP